MCSRKKRERLTKPDHGSTFSQDDVVRQAPPPRQLTRDAGHRDAASQLPIGTIQMESRAVQPGNCMPRP
eukprot:1899916-Pyramimonas_sp.AAC.1